MRIALFGRNFKEKNFSDVKKLIQYLDNLSITIGFFEDFYHFLKKHHLIDKEYLLFNNTEEIGTYDYVLSIGGDGTLLEAVTLIREKEIPILGINAGRLGFMTTTPIDESIQAVEKLIKGDFKLDKRNLVKCISEKNFFNGVNFGLNELSIQKRDTSSMIVIHAYINGEFLNSYWGDGLIVSTATGSTGYSLSCGGPLLIPGNSNFILAPVIPHSLNVRPLVIPDTSILTFEIEGRASKILLSLDSRSISTPINTKLTVTKASFNVFLVKFKDDSYFTTLRQKLNWGIDSRN